MRQFTSIQAQQLTSFRSSFPCLLGNEILDFIFWHFVNVPSLHWCVHFLFTLLSLNVCIFQGNKFSLLLLPFAFSVAYFILILLCWPFIDKKKFLFFSAGLKLDWFLWPSSLFLFYFLYYRYCFMYITTHYWRVVWAPQWTDFYVEWNFYTLLITELPVDLFQPLLSLNYLRPFHSLYHLSFHFFTPFFACFFFFFPHFIKLTLIQINSKEWAATTVKECRLKCG